MISSTSGANANKEPKEPLRPPKVSWFAATMKKWDPRGDKRRVAIITIAFVICTLIIAFSEMQAVANCVSDENTQWGFGQVSAVRSDPEVSSCSQITDRRVSFCVGTSLEYCSVSAFTIIYSGGIR